MNTKNFLQALLQEPLQSEYLLQGFLRDHVFENLHNMTTPRVGQLINTAVKFMMAGEIYCEVGSYQGATMISALYETGCKGISIENFSEFQETNSPEILRGNLDKWLQPDQFIMATCGYKEFFTKQMDEFQDQRIGVYFYDGAHDELNQYEGLMYAIPYLASEALLIVDDANYPQVQSGTHKFIEREIEYIPSFLLITTDHFPDPVWWNGLYLIHWKRND